MVSEEQESEMELASEKIPVPPVEKTVEEPAKVEESKPEVPHKKSRKRYKELHGKIIKQMEFYFGDANLSKDRFLSKLIGEDPWVHLNIFMSFNKIKILTTDVSRIAKALKESMMLKVSEDGTKVCRTTPIQEKENSEECTIYVQRLPPEADHDWISTTFSQYGSIDYISLPKYRNKAIKGFAFVEYTIPEDAQKCIKAFRAKGCVLPSDTSLNSILSITTHEHCDEEVTKEPILTKEVREQQMETENYEESDSKKDSTSQAPPNGKKKKRKRMSIEETVSSTEAVEDSKKNKRKKHGSGTESDRSDSVSNSLKVEKTHKRCRKRRRRNAESLNASDGNDEHNDSSASECDRKRKKIKHKSSESEPKKESVSKIESLSEERSNIPKKRKKMDSEEANGAEATNDEGQSSEDVNTKKAEEKKSDPEAVEEAQPSEEIKAQKEKKKKRKRNRSSRKEDLDAPDTGIEVMGKREWKRLRNKYLEMQRAKMKQLKQHLKRAAWNQWQNVEKINAEKDESSEKDVTKVEKSPRFSFTPGVIVKIEMESPCSDPKNFKMELKGGSSNSAVQYVDVSEGSNVAFVRCDSAESAKALVQKATEERTMIVLDGEEEKSYWDKIAQDRQEKIGNNLRVKQRGRDKLLKKAEKELGKHIKFDEG